MTIDTEMIAVRDDGKIAFLLRRGEHQFFGRGIGSRQELVDTFVGWSKVVPLPMSEVFLCMLSWRSFPQVDCLISSWPSLEEE